MIFNYLKFARRNLVKHKTSALLNILSLAVGITCFTFIAVYIHSELKYDRFHEHADDIYRIPIDFVDSKGNRLPDATTPPALAPALMRDFPEVHTAVRLFPSWGGQFRLATENNRQFFEADFMRTDSTFFDVFTFPFLHGDKESALDAPDQVVITRKMALKYFGREDVIGEKIILVGDENKTYQVSGVLRDLPEESHFHFDFLTKIDFDGLGQNWGWYNYYTYARMNEAVDMTSFESRLQPFYESYQDTGEEYYNIIYTQPLTDIHLTSRLKWELEANGDINTIYIFAALGLFVMLVSCLNYINLTISQSVRRFKEVGVRKVFGAHRSALISQFMVETFLTAIIALVAGFALTELAFAQLNPLLQKQLSLLDWQGVWFMLVVGAVVMGIGLLAGIFPAYHLTSFQVALAVKGLRSNSGTSIKKIRSTLLIIQFAISSLMISAALVVHQQLDFMQQLDKGFEPEQVLVIENGEEVGNYHTFKNEILGIPEVQSVGNASGVLGQLNWTTRVGYPDPFVMNYLVIDPDFIETMGMQMTSGRPFSAERSSDKEGWTMMVNEAANRALGLTDEQLGQTLPITQIEDSIIYGTVIGVIKDFQFTDLKMETKPFAFFYREEPLDFINLKISSHHMNETLIAIEDSWTKLSGGAPLNYFFLDQVYEDLLQEENVLSQLMLGLTFLSFFIAFIGMFSIANIRLKDKTKEIAVRKVLGSSVIDVMQLMTTKFVKLVMLSNVISIPLAYYFAQSWLDNFIYRTTLGWGVFAAAFLSTLLVVVVVVGGQSIRAATENPIRNLRQE
ncbi:MAG: ABC transporter permease [Reichenbachiella sp.]|uniref:ABC transporter permease n=1 Tax=Reichenbachiella sp. TaxID=2184521 RepID=UPI002966011A|nr:ABC transporter permease [Reichenbachiella sp.]MDW3212049.1 ABC transporter permease [Reichenbachiella sp.]